MRNEIDGPSAVGLRDLTDAGTRRMSSPSLYLLLELDHYASLRWALALSANDRLLLVWFSGLATYALTHLLTWQARR
jgi:hypothetical protein